MDFDTLKFEDIYNDCESIFLVSFEDDNLGSIILFGCLSKEDAEEYVRIKNQEYKVEDYSGDHFEWFEIKLVPKVKVNMKE